MANNKNKKIESFEQLAEMQQRKRPAASNEEPAISSMLDEFEMWMAVNWKKAIIGVCAFAVAVSVIIIIQGVMRSAEESARKELANADGIEGIEAAIAKHPNNKAADFERLNLAGELIASGTTEDLEKAHKLLLDVASSSKSKLFIRTRSALDAAYILEKLGKKKDAAEEFIRIAGLDHSSEDIDLRIEAAYSAARLFTGLDQTMSADSALEIFDKLTAAAQNHSPAYDYWTTLANTLKEKIGSKIEAAAPASSEKPAENAPATQPPAVQPAATQTPAAQTPAAEAPAAQQPAENAAPQPVN